MGLRDNSVARRTAVPQAWGSVPSSLMTGSSQVPATPGPGGAGPNSSLWENANKQPFSSNVTSAMRLGSTYLADGSIYGLPFKINGNILTLRAQQNYHFPTLKANF